MAFTADGNALAAHGLIVQLLGGFVEVTDGGDRSARTPIDNTFPRRDGATITIRATFDQANANFDWRVRRVLAPDGTVVDEENVDMGRKVDGSVWSIDVELEVG